MDIDVSELNKLSASLEQATKEVLPQVRRVVQKSSADIKRDGQAFAPVDTGFLRSSISYETRELRDTVIGEIGPTASYAAFVEYGTSRMAPHAFMGPALDRNGHLFEKAIGQVLQKVAEQ